VSRRGLYSGFLVGFFGVRLLRKGRWRFLIAGLFLLILVLRVPAISSAAKFLDRHSWLLLIVGPPVVYAAYWVVGRTQPNSNIVSVPPHESVPVEWLSPGVCRFRKLDDDWYVVGPPNMLKTGQRVTIERKDGETVTVELLDVTHRATESWARFERLC
jgi:hypothetical protein